MHAAAEGSCGAERKETAHHFRKEEKRPELSGRRIATVSNSLALPNEVRKAAWQVPEEENGSDAF